MDGDVEVCLSGPTGAQGRAAELPRILLGGNVSAHILRVGGQIDVSASNGHRVEWVCEDVRVLGLNV